MKTCRLPFFKMNKGKVTFKPPPAFKLPEGIKDGEQFSVLAEFKVEGDRLCLVGVDGNELPAYEETEPGHATEQRYNAALPDYDNGQT